MISPTKKVATMFLEQHKVTNKNGIGLLLENDFEVRAQQAPLCGEQGGSRRRNIRDCFKLECECHGSL